MPLQQNTLEWRIRNACLLHDNLKKKRVFWPLGHDSLEFLCLYICLRPIICLPTNSHNNFINVNEQYCLLDCCGITIPFRWIHLPLSIDPCWAGLLESACCSHRHQTLLGPWEWGWPAGARRPRWGRGRSRESQWPWWRAHRCPTDSKSPRQQWVRSLAPGNPWSQKFPARSPMEWRVSHIISQIKENQVH